MAESRIGTVALLFHGDRNDPLNERLTPVGDALEAAGVAVRPTPYVDARGDEVRQRLLGVDGVLVWRNPIQDGADRSTLDPMLRDVAETGVFVSAHPDVILKMGSKDVLYATRDMAWGTDTHRYATLDQMRAELPARLAAGPRVLKRFRGNGGDGVRRVEAAGGDRVKVRCAKRGCMEEIMTFDALYVLCAPYFAEGGTMIDQQYQERLTDGMIRCYMTQKAVAGFGRQEVNALFPAPEGARPEDAPQPTPRLYHPEDAPQFQRLRRKMEDGWAAEMQCVLGIVDHDLPLLWDADFLFGPKDGHGEDTYVLCEINCSSVAPYPPSAPPFIAEAVLSKLRSR